MLGMPGAGKTSVGRLLARSLDAVFIDLDERIELLFGTSVAQLFARGEPLFRARERSALCALVEEPGFAGSATVVATGGGIVSDLENLRTMSSVGRLVYLEADVETLRERLCTPEQRATRPLLADEPHQPMERGASPHGGRRPSTGGFHGREDKLTARLSELLAAREPSYRQAPLIIDGRGSPEQVAARVLQKIVPAKL